MPRLGELADFGTLLLLILYLFAQLKDNVVGLTINHKNCRWSCKILIEFQNAFRGEIDKEVHMFIE